MRNEPMTTGTVKMKYVEAFVEMNDLRKEIAFFEKEKDEAQKARDDDRRFDAVLELKALYQDVALAELNMMYFADILKMRNEIV